jgi:hypothetical protein
VTTTTITLLTLDVVLGWTSVTDITEKNEGNQKIAKAKLSKLSISSQIHLFAQ